MEPCFTNKVTAKLLPDQSYYDAYIDCLYRGIVVLQHPVRRLEKTDCVSTQKMIEEPAGNTVAPDSSDTC